MEDFNCIEYDYDKIEKLYRKAFKSGESELAEKYKNLLELCLIRSDLELSCGDTNIHQAGGLYKDLVGKYKGYEIHHIPAKSIQAENARYLPAIALTKRDHEVTDSYRYKSNKKRYSFLPDVLDVDIYKQDAKKMIDNNKYLTVVRYELYNIKDNFGNKYDGGISQYLDTLYSIILEKGLPKSK